VGASMSGSTSSRGQVVQNGGHRHRGWIPPSAASEISNRAPSPRSWDAYRRMINKVLASNEQFIRDNGLTDKQVKEMASGFNPTADTGTRGKRVKLEWDHYKERQDGHDQYDLSNLRLVSPDGHIRKIGRKFLIAAST